MNFKIHIPPKQLDWFAFTVKSFVLFKIHIPPKLRCSYFAFNTVLYCSKFTYLLNRKYSLLRLHMFCTVQNSHTSQTPNRFNCDHNCFVLFKIHIPPKPRSKITPFCTVQNSHTSQTTFSPVKSHYSFVLFKIHIPPKHLCGVFHHFCWFCTVQNSHTSQTAHLIKLLLNGFVLFKIHIPPKQRDQVVLPLCRFVLFKIHIPPKQLLVVIITSQVFCTVQNSHTSQTPQRLVQYATLFCTVQNSHTSQTSNCGWKVCLNLCKWIFIWNRLWIVNSKTRYVNFKQYKTAFKSV